MIFFCFLTIIPAQLLGGNMMRIQKILCIAALCLLAGCSTSYHSISFLNKTGYNDFRVSKDTFTVTFRGNSYTTPEDVYKFTLLRASELALKNHFKYFVVVSEKDISTTSLEYTASEYSEVVTDKKFPGTCMTIKCYEEMPKKDYIEASEFIAFNT